MSSTDATEPTVAPVPVAAPEPAPVPEQPLKKKRNPPAAAPVREGEGSKSLLPFTRVQKIIKADKEIPIMAKDATFLISLATEEFIKRLAHACHKAAARENRVTIQHKDVATVVRKADEFLFLEEMIPWTASDTAPKRKPKGLTAAATAESSFLEKFMGGEPAKDTTPSDEEVEAPTAMDGVEPT